MRETPRTFIPSKLEKENPCHGCTDRYPACHADCLKRAHWLESVAEARHQQNEQERGYRLAKSFSHESRERAISKMSKIRKSKYKT